MALGCNGWARHVADVFHCRRHSGCPLHEPAPRKGFAPSYGSSDLDGDVHPCAVGAFCRWSGFNAVLLLASVSGYKAAEIETVLLRSAWPDQRKKSQGSRA